MEAFFSPVAIQSPEAPADTPALPAAAFLGGWASSLPRPMVSGRLPCQAESPSVRGIETVRNCSRAELHPGAIIRSGHTYSHKNMSHIIHDSACAWRSLSCSWLGLAVEFPSLG